MTQGEITRASLQSEVIRRAWESMQFKQKLLARPREALQEIGYTLDEDVEVMVVQEHKKKLVLVLPESPLSTAQEEIMGPAIPASTLGCPQTASGCELTRGSDCQFTSAPDCTRPKPTFQCPSTGSSCQPTAGSSCEITSSPDCTHPKPTTVSGCAPSTGSSCQPATVSSCQITSAPDCTHPKPTTVSGCAPSTGSSCQPTSDCRITGSDCVTPIPKTVSQCAPSTGSSCQPATVSGCSPTPGKP